MDEGEKRLLLWGSFEGFGEKAFLFVSYLMGTNNPEQFFIKEVETGKTVKLVSFAKKHGITKELIKKY